MGIRVGAVDEAPLGFLAVVRETLAQLERFLARQQGDTIVTLLAVVVNVISQGADFRFGKLIVADLGFLQADHIRLVLLDQRCELMRARPQAVDVEGNEFHVGDPGDSAVKEAMLADQGNARPATGQELEMVLNVQERWNSGLP